jgi:hypothetical protein
MERSAFLRVLACLLPCFLLLLVTPLAADQPEPPCKGQACVDYGGVLDDADPTLPLEKAAGKKVDERRAKEKERGQKHEGRIHPQCAAELDKDPADRDEARIAKFCDKSPGRKKEVLKNHPIRTPDGKQRGKVVKTRTTLTFEKPGQRYGHEKEDRWKDFVFKQLPTGDLTARGYRGQSNTADRARNKNAFFEPDSTANDDRDCVDTFTGEHRGGADIPDGDPNSCFDTAGVLKQTLAAVGSDGCVHEDGTFVSGVYPPEDDDGDGIPDGNQCYNADGTLKTTLVELIDEDGASPDHESPGDGVYDIDGDGLDGEDGPDPGGYAINNDRDCVDAVTGAHLRDADCFEGGALRRTLSPAFLGCVDGAGDYHDGDPYDGVEDDCYQGSGLPWPEMTPLPDGCRHEATNTFFEGDPDDGEADECYDRQGVLRTTLAELVDEDDGVPVDDDDDGVADEDGPASPMDFEQECLKQARKIADDPNFDTSGIYSPGEGCNLTRPIIVRANKRAMEQHGEKAYKADDQGYFDDTVGGEAKEFGTEGRKLEIEEEFTLLCEVTEVFDEETGQCVTESQVQSLADFRARAMGETSMQEYALMGFTFAPPRIRWGLFYKEELDLWLFSITLIEVKLGYDFALGVGFRLPVGVEVSGIPDPAILAGSNLTLTSTVRPEDFTAAQYEDFCLARGMGDASYCRRFAFADALDPVQGDELAIRLTVFAGLKVVLLEIPLINWGVDLDMDLPEMCSLYLAYDNIEDVAQEMALSGVGFAEAMETLNLNCGTYTTPYGNDPQGEPLQFPFIQNAPFVNQMIRADCAEAFLRDETVKLPDGEVYPLCTGLILGMHGASLGLGLGVDLEMNSNLIEANAAVTGDGIFDGQEPGYVQELDYFAAPDGGSLPTEIGALRLDNYDDRATEDHARLAIDDFTYCLNNFSIRLKGQAMFGGILTIFPDFPDFTIYRMTVPIIDELCFIPIGQHAGTGTLEVPVLVENYGLEVDIGTDPADPNRIDAKTLQYPPDKSGLGGDFLVSVRNLGSFAGSFQNFAYQLSNQRDQVPPFTFFIDPDNDADGLVDEDDFGPAGQTYAVRDEDGDGLADEDPPDSWQTVPPFVGFNAAVVSDVPAHTGSVDAGIEPLTLRITPFVHPSTRPGLYPFRITADSTEATLLGLDAVDPSGNRRLGALDVGFIKVETFYEPEVAIQPAAPSNPPGVLVRYTVEGTNMGNGDDSMSVAVDFLDFNTASCDLVDRGTRPGCPYRATVTGIDPAWTNVASLATSFGPLDPLESDTDELQVTAPTDWEGMEDTAYSWTGTVVSLGDSDPPATDTRTVEFIVQATLESQARFIRHEAQELVAVLEAANARGTETGGLLPIAAHPVLSKCQRALDQVLAGAPASSRKTLESAVKVTEAFVHALEGFDGKGSKLPADLDVDLRRRAVAILKDLALVTGT